MKDRSEKIVIVTQKTAIEELIEKHNSVSQAKFYLQHSGTDFDDYLQAHEIYQHAKESLKSILPSGVRIQWIDRGFLPNYLFGERDTVLLLGRDGLVVNTAKYLHQQPIVAINPDPTRIDGVLLPFNLPQLAIQLPAILKGDYQASAISLAEVNLNNGQSLHAVCDLFIGQKTHTSARYKVTLEPNEEIQSSSGVIISTGTGSTGWFRSILTGATRLVGLFEEDQQLISHEPDYAFDRESDILYFSVREPFVSRTSNASMTFGKIMPGQTLIIESRMPQNGVIFSDGIESDYLDFNSGTIARINLAKRKVILVKNNMQPYTTLSQQSSQS